MKTELRIASIGNVDSAKSTTISCLSYDILDNGRGEARKKILKHPHEGYTGRTSSITQHFVSKNDRLINFIDLAGHEKYLKTTMSGLSGCYIDYAMVTIGADRGIIGMTKEHMGIAIALKIPLFIVITKIDMSPPDKLKKIIDTTVHLMKCKAAGSKEPIIIQYNDDISKIDSWQIKNICPIFLTSNTEGTNLENLKNFVYNLPSKNNWDIQTKNKIFVIDDVFKVKGVGIVLSGIVTEGNLLPGDQINLGPFNGKFKPFIIKSIHDNFRNSIDTLTTGNSGCINIKFINNKKETICKKDIKKGMIGILFPKCIKEFDADILILKHPTTITNKYQPVIHCGTVRQTAKINKMNQELLRTGDKATITFEFLFHPEYLECGNQVVFRDGNTKGIGTITNVKI